MKNDKACEVQVDIRPEKISSTDSREMEAVFIKLENYTCRSSPVTAQDYQVLYTFVRCASSFLFLFPLHHECAARLEVQNTTSSVSLIVTPRGSGSGISASLSRSSYI